MRNNELTNEPTRLMHSLHRTTNVPQTQCVLRFNNWLMCAHLTYPHCISRSTIYLLYHLMLRVCVHLINHWTYLGHFVKRRFRWFLNQSFTAQNLAQIDKGKQNETKKQEGQDGSLFAQLIQRVPCTTYC